jgi:hypothetical protein
MYSGDRGMGRTGPLAIDNLVEVVGLLDISRLQCFSFDPFGFSLSPAFYAFPAA